MKLAELTLAALAKMDLNGVEVTKILIEGDSTSSSFEINGMEIEFVIDNDGQAYGTALLLNDQTYTDAETLAKCTGWVDYVATVVKKAMSEQQTEIEEAEQVVETVTAENKDSALPAVPEFKRDERPVVPEFKIAAEPEVPVLVVEKDSSAEEEVEKEVEEAEATPQAPIPEIPMLKERIVEETVDKNPKTKNRIEEPPAPAKPSPDEGIVMQNRRIAEAFERGRREGYTESRKMNLAEVKKVRRRATIFILILILLFAAAFGVIYILFGEDAGFYVPEVLQIFNNNDTPSTIPAVIESY